MPLRSMLCRAAFAVALVLPAAAVSAQEKLPETMTLTAYDTGSSGFNIAVAVGNMLKDKHGTNVRVLPAGNDVARLAPLKADRAQMSAMGVGVYFAQEGVFEFAAKEWGPQPLRLVLSVMDCHAVSLGVAKDTGVKEFKDLKGKRIGMVVGSPALNQNALAILAFAGLTKDDVKLVEFAGYGAMWKGLLNNEADAAIASNISAQAKEVDTSPRGVVYPETPFADKEGWARLNKIAPYYAPHKTTCGIGVAKGSTLELPNYPYPIFMVYGSQPAELVYGIAKSMITNYDAYKDAAPGAAGLEGKRQILSWVVPYHEGSVKALKEAGIWTAEADAHNAALIKRQDVMAAAWSDFVKGSAAADEAAFNKSWLAARKEALVKAGLDPIFE
jgi:TRAP transporter TAXI family solute receptor